MSIALYHSGSLGAASHGQTLMKLIDFRLLSFHEKYVVTARNYIRQVQNVRDTSNVTIMFDSGAFTAWKRKENIGGRISNISTHRGGIPHYPGGIYAG